MKFILDHYFLFAGVIGIVHFIISGMNIIFKFTEIPLFMGFFKWNEPTDLKFNLLIILFLSFMFSLVWPIMLTFLIVYTTIYYYPKF